MTCPATVLARLPAAPCAGQAPDCYPRSERQTLFVKECSTPPVASPHPLPPPTGTGSIISRNSSARLCPISGCASRALPITCRIAALRAGGAQWAGENTTAADEPVRASGCLCRAHRCAQRPGPRRPGQLRAARRGADRGRRSGRGWRRLRGHGARGATRHPAAPTGRGRSRAGRPALISDRLPDRR